MIVSQMPIIRLKEGEDKLKIYLKNTGGIKFERRNINKKSRKD